MGAKVKAEGKELWAELNGPRFAKPNRTQWLLTFIDLVGILVGFFVLLFSTQMVDRQRWEDVSGSFKASFGVVRGVVEALPSEQANSIAVARVERDVLPYLDSLLRSRVQRDAVWRGLVGRVEVEQGRKTLVYALPRELMTLGEAEQTKAWQRLAQIVRAWRNVVTVRVSVPADQAALGAERLRVLVALMVASGAANVTGELRFANMASTQLTVKGSDF